MALSDTQVRQLRAKLDGKHVKTRSANGADLHYVEGWHVIAEANRIFGFDGWSRETVESRCVLAREARGTFLVVYIARVRVTSHPRAIGARNACGPEASAERDSASLAGFPVVWCESCSICRRVFPRLPRARRLSRLRRRSLGAKRSRAMGHRPRSRHILKKAGSPNGRGRREAAHDPPDLASVAQPPPRDIKESPSCSGIRSSRA